MTNTAHEAGPERRVAALGLGGVEPPDELKGGVGHHAPLEVAGRPEAQTERIRPVT